VASLTVAAEAALCDARRLRSEAKGLRLAARRNVAYSRERLDTAQLEADRAQARRAIPCASPWSGLVWCLEDAQLGRVLVPVD
jgi:hypothetical protein